MESDAWPGWPRREPDRGDAESPVDAEDRLETAPEARDDSGPAREAGHEAVRARLIGRFEAWLDCVLADEPPPAGVAAELLRELEAGDAPDAGEQADQFALWAAMTALTQEVKLQGRAFGRLHEALAPVTEIGPLLGENLAAHCAALDTAREIAREALAARGERDRQTAREAERRAAAGLLDVLLDVRDRLVRGLELARRHAGRLARRPRWRRLLRLDGGETRELREVTAALEQGYALALARLDEALDRMSVHETECVGRPFDPIAMTAAEVAEHPELPDGTVIEVHRTGYQWHSETFRLAHVKVARSRSAAHEGIGDEQS